LNAPAAGPEIASKYQYLPAAPGRGRLNGLDGVVESNYLERLAIRTTTDEGKGKG
jgi:hypothetical protein